MQQELELHHQFAEIKLYYAVHELNEVESKQALLQLYHCYLEQKECLDILVKQLRKTERLLQKGK